MENEKRRKRIAIIGGGPSGLFMYKRLVESKDKQIEIHIFERKEKLGMGMPYSEEGANTEHVTNVSSNEIPQLPSRLSEWVQSLPSDKLAKFGLQAEHFHEHKVVPRLLFGHYLSAQFDLLLAKAKELHLPTHVHLDCIIDNIIDLPEQEKVRITAEQQEWDFDHVVICTGHNWPKQWEGKQDGYFDSPYPPSKLSGIRNHPIAIKGSSLTAIDAVRTLARQNGRFIESEKGELIYQVNDNCPHFKLVMHSKNALLPAVRFHLQDADLAGHNPLSLDEILAHKQQNEGFLPLDLVFERDFKEGFKSKDIHFYERIKDMRMEEFVSSMMEMRERVPAFDLLRAEYVEAEKSIQRKKPVHWKESLAVLSFAMNRPAKHFSAEDMLRLKQVLMPLISVVIAFVPQRPCLELLALHEAGRLELVEVGDDSEAKPSAQGGADYSYTSPNSKSHKEHYTTFVDCVGQSALPFEGFPFKGLLEGGTISPAYLKFKSQSEGIKAQKEGKLEVETDGRGNFYLKVPGIAIDDSFRVLDTYGTCNNRVFIMAVPYIGGFNPDYSGLDFCEEASERIANHLLISLAVPQLDGLCKT